MKHCLSAALLVLASFFFSGPTVCAQPSLGVHIGYNTDLEETFIGGNGWFSLGSISDLGVMLNPALSLYPFADNLTYLTVDANILLGLTPAVNTVVPFAGLGGSYRYTSTELAGNSSDFGLNITGGVLLHIIGLQPFAQGTFTVSEGTSFSLQAGISIPI